MGVILLVRHGQASFGASNYDVLSAHGERQAARLGASLVARGIDVARVLCGDLHRQRQTADFIAQAVGAEAPSIDPRWNEYDPVQLVARLEPIYGTESEMIAQVQEAPDPTEAFQNILEHALDDWVAAGAGPSDGAADGLQSFYEYQSQASQALSELTAASGTTVVVSSAGTISAAAAQLIDLPDAAWPRFQRVMVNTSVTKIVSGRTGVSMVAFNEHGHLEGVPGVSITYR